MESSHSPDLHNKGFLDNINNIETRIKTHILQAVHNFVDNTRLAECSIPPSKIPDVQLWIEKFLEHADGSNDLVGSHSERSGNLTDASCEEHCTSVNTCVKIVNASIKKGFLGGYVHRGTGVEFHDACSQTQPASPRTHSTTHRFTQTVAWQNKAQNTHSTRHTQMYRRDHFVPSVGDRIITAKQYITADESQERALIVMTREAVVIQKHFRGWVGRRHVADMAEKKRHREVLERRQQGRTDEEQARWLKRRFTVQTYPKTREDFEMLYALLERWRLDQIAHIEDVTSGAGRKVMLWFLLKKQLKLLLRIEQLWNEAWAGKVCKSHELDETAKAKQWVGYKNLIISMETLNVQQARELRELYRSLSQDMLVEERIELLICLKHALANLNLEHARELLVLIDRECEFLAIGLGAQQLVGLRNRILCTFLNVVNDPLVNSGMASLKTEKQLDSTQQDMVRCDRCLMFQHHSRFPLHTLRRMFTCCTRCEWYDKVGRTRLDLSLYRYIARAVRRDEQSHAAYCSVAFIMSDEDFYHLVAKIWQGSSAISKSTDLKQLRLCRWTPASIWSPWNCILLTVAEAKAHCSLTDLVNIYEDAFRDKVKRRHSVAKLHFEHLARNDPSAN